MAKRRGGAREPCIAPQLQKRDQLTASDFMPRNGGHLRETYAIE